MKSVIILLVFCLAVPSIGNAQTSAQVGFITSYRPLGSIPLDTTVIIYANLYLIPGKGGNSGSIKLVSSSNNVKVTPDILYYFDIQSQITIQVHDTALGCFSASIQVVSVDSQIQAASGLFIQYYSYDPNASEKIALVPDTLINFGSVPDSQFAPTTLDVKFSKDSGKIYPIKIENFNPPFLDDTLSRLGIYLDPCELPYYSYHHRQEFQ